ncbi:MAG: AmmeMemoRadiSam system protein B [Prevotella sp.]|nr:AmmeMemoRadiSam system protein B [Prevotella sp.]
MQPPVVRPATQAGRFYESDALRLSEEVDSLLALHAKSDTTNHVAAIIVPHAGYYFSGNVAASAYARLNPQHPYKRIFMLGPSHHEWLNGASVDSETDYYATPLGDVEVDRQTAQRLIEADSVFAFREEAHNREHCLEVQLPFLQRRFANAEAGVPPIVPIIISTNDYDKLKRMARVLKPYLNDENLFIISSDFSHYPSYRDACEIDARTGEAVASGDPEKFIATIEANARSGKRNLATSACGEFPIITLLLMLDKGYDVRHIMYQNSGDADDSDHSRVVGYHAFEVVRKQSAEEAFKLSETDRQKLKEIALSSISKALEGKIDTPDVKVLAKTHPTLAKRCGAFVSLHKHGQLRGCIGHFGEDYPLCEIVAEMARSAAFEDPRFMPLRKTELDDVDIEISVLTPMRRIKSLDEFQLHRHGIYIRKGMNSGTYLPQVADEVNWSKEEFVSHCSRDKAGLGWDGWRDAELYVYEAIVF